MAFYVNDISCSVVPLDGFEDIFCDMSISLVMYREISVLLPKTIIQSAVYRFFSHQLCYPVGILFHEMR